MADKKINITRGKKELGGETNRQLLTLASDLVARVNLAAQMGKSFGGDRDLYTILGYPKVLTYEHYQARYERQDIATKIIECYPQGCWGKHFDIEDNKKEESKFERAWLELVERTSLYHYIERVDILNRIGQYAVLLLGFEGTKEFIQPVENGKKLLYVTAYAQINADVFEWEKDPMNERYGLPKIYELKLSTGDKSGISNLKVHHSRLIHVAEGCLESDVYGKPSLQNVYNRLQDLELISGSSAEMFYRGAYPGISFEVDAGTSISAQSSTAFKDEIEEYIHNLKRYMRLQGIKANQLSPQVASPQDHKNLLIDLISAGADIPRRILIGNEQGELASSQDERNWNTKLNNRKANFCEPKIQRQLIDRLMEYGTLPEPQEGKYNVIWPELSEKTDDERASIRSKKITMVKEYVSTPGADQVIPPQTFLTDFLEYDKDEAEDILKEGQKLADEEAEEIAAAEEEAKKMADEQAAIDAKQKEIDAAKK